MLKASLHLLLLWLLRVPTYRGTRSCSTPSETQGMPEKQNRLDGRSGREHQASREEPITKEFSGPGLW